MALNHILWFIDDYGAEKILSILIDSDLSKSLLVQPRLTIVTKDASVQRHKHHSISVFDS